MFPCSSPSYFNLPALFPDVDNGYVRRPFLSYTPEEAIGHPFMLMDIGTSRDQDYQESQELREVFEILLPRLVSYESRDIQLSSTDFVFNQTYDNRQDLKKKVKPNAGEQPCCACPRSKCLKLYCVCLQKNNYCGKDCSCKGCFNDIWHEEERQKVIETEKFKNLFVGCKCKRSRCQQKYCECYISGRICGKACKCKGCKNQGPSHNHSHGKLSDVMESSKSMTQMA